VIEVFYYISAEKAEDAFECGIKLSDWFSKEIMIGSEMKRCITGLLNPRDDLTKYMSSQYKCLKLEVMPKYCYIADSLLYELGLKYPEAMEMYIKSIVPADSYTFGDYRQPECLITSTILAEQISLLGNGLDTPIFYSSSHELFFNTIFEGLREAHDDLNDALLYYLFKSLTEAGKLTCIEDPDKGLAAFSSSTDGRIYTLHIPDLSKY